MSAALAILSPVETDDLARHERVIRAGLDTFVQVGQALAAIRDERLYRATHGTFEDYCRERWQMDRTYAHRLTQAAEVVGMLPMDNTVPTSERQARPLTKLRNEPDRARAAWSRAVESAPRDDQDRPRVTAALVQNAVRDELAARRDEITARQQQAAQNRAEVDAFNQATAHLVPQMEADSQWSLPVIAVSHALDKLPTDIDPGELARNVPDCTAYRLDALADALPWLTALYDAHRTARET